MSIRWIDHVWRNSPYSGERLLIHLALADTAHDDGRLWITQAHLADKARCSVEWVRKTVRQMEQDGVLVVATRGTRGHATVYELKKVAPNSVGLFDDDVAPNSEPNTPNSKSNTPNSTNTPSVLTSIPTSTDVPDVTSVAKAVASDWWERQQPRPIGKNAWHSLLAVCRAAVERGFEPASIVRALDSIGTVPSIAQLDRALRHVGVRQSARQERLQRGLALAQSPWQSNGRELEA